MAEVFLKSPTESESRTFNWEPWLGVLTIASSVWTVPSGLVEDASSNTSTTTTVRLSGGTDGEDYEVINRITTSDGQTQERVLVVQVREVSNELTNDELVTVAEIIQESYSETQTWAEGLNANQMASIRIDIATWATIRDSHVRVSGGSDAVDFDNERKRQGIRQRIRKMLGLSLVSDEALALTVGSLSLIDLEVGQNFDSVSE